MIERVQKIMANRGYCSRRAAEELIANRKVSVNGKTIGLGDKADPDKDEIYIGNTPLPKPKKMYIMLNKPKHYEVTLNPLIKKNVLELINISERVFPVGRLDRTTTGLLLLTNDGDFANNISHPRYNVEKTYYVQLDKHLSKEDMNEIVQGIKLSDGFIKGKIRMINKDSLELTIHEGKKHIIKRLFFKLGYYVKELSRIRIGTLKLDVKQGNWRFLKDKEVKDLLTGKKII